MFTFAQLKVLKGKYAHKPDILEWLQRIEREKLDGMTFNKGVCY